MRKPKLPRGGELAASTNVQLQVRVVQNQLMHETWIQGGQPFQVALLHQQQWLRSVQHQQDPSQIDGAALAQAWSARREAPGLQSMVQPPPGRMPSGRGMSTMESGPNHHGNFQGDSNFNRMWQPG
ncbi:arginine/serine-rich protein PNISR-like [Mesoplodon densirostris]|uniref:arginine/serine-rich protein PNISR-like n=1 Tax=Mesoplodon densirostris TaxID=48708 RepID=UPI0028DBD94C|nr:arginine/serine-rich protein PNISR-like [Mesoplodon densirostris]